MDRIDTYIPFDFGTWREESGTMICPRHGRQDGGLVISVVPRRGEKPIYRKLCGMCVLDAIDRIGTMP